jgi:hypothetical protein
MPGGVPPPSGITNRFVEARGVLVHRKSQGGEHLVNNVTGCGRQHETKSNWIGISSEVPTTIIHDVTNGAGVDLRAR